MRLTFVPRKIQGKAEKEIADCDTLDMFYLRYVKGITRWGVHMKPESQSQLLTIVG